MDVDLFAARLNTLLRECLCEGWFEELVELGLIHLAERLRGLDPVVKFL